MNIPALRHFITATLLALTALSAQAQSDLQNRLFACAGVEDVLARLACFDDLSRAESAALDEQRVVQTPAPASASPVAEQQAEQPSPPQPVARPAPPQPVAEVRETTPAPVATPEESAGAVRTFGQSTATARVEADAEGNTELVDTVTAVRQVDPTKIQITLSSGQVWRQTVGKRYLLREGDTVHISGSSWGDEFRLSADGKRGFIQVRRVE